VPEDSEHLTHVFLGERGEPVESFLSALAPIARFAKLPIGLGRAHVFPHRGRPRLVCLEVFDPADGLPALAFAVHRRLSLLLPDLADHPPKTPHVTLARFRRGARRRETSEVEAQLARIGLATWVGSDTVASVELIESRLSAAGARYEVLHRVALVGAEPGKPPSGV
jgi:2'-5' RNA ligase